MVIQLKKLGIDDLVHFDFMDPPAPEVPYAIQLPVPVHQSFSSGLKFSSLKFKKRLTLIVETWQAFFYKSIDRCTKKFITSLQFFFHSNKLIPVSYIKKKLPEEQLLRSMDFIVHSQSKLPAV